MNTDDKRLIEDYLPIEAISAEASREKSVRKGHISTLHLWWARRPLVACRAAVYGALVPADRFVPPNGADDKRKSLGRANAARFIKQLCQYPKDSDPDQVRIVDRAIGEAQRHILTAHADRLTAELTDWKAGKTGKPGWVDEFKWQSDSVATEDIVASRAPRPRVLDMFAGGGAIPLEALRLGCEAYANDLNPVAHIIQLCTLVYPQKYGKPDPNAKGLTGPNGTWGGLAEEVRYWGNWILKKVTADIGDLYPPILDPEYKGKPSPIEFDKESGAWVVTFKGAKARSAEKKDPFASFRPGEAAELPPGYLMPVAYLWTRTVKCKNPTCGATVPLVKQTWLCKKDGRSVAMKMVAPRGKKDVRFEVVEARSEKGLGFDPEAFSKAGNATCPFCGTVADSDYVKAEGCAGKMGQQLMTIVTTRSGKQGKVYLSPDHMQDFLPDENAISKRIDKLNQDTGLTAPDEPIEGRMTGGSCLPYGITDFGKMFSARQKLYLLTLAKFTKGVISNNNMWSYDIETGKSIATFMAVFTDRQADYSSNGCIWEPGGEFIKSTFSRQAIPFVMDYAELAPFGGGSGSPEGALDWITSVCAAVSSLGQPAAVNRGSATTMPWDAEKFDAIITDPPYYDNVDYAKIADFFYVWLKRTAGHIYPAHFASQTTPKKNEAVADPIRHGGIREKARRAYEDMMAASFKEANRVLKPYGEMVVVYAHKTTLGWSTLVEALRSAGFLVSEAWPLDTERPGRVISLNTSSLASSIFLIARKRDAACKAGNFETDVVPELSNIVRERVETLWAMGISGADIVIACVGAGLRAFTKYSRVEFANGEEVPAERFLSEVEAVVLETILGKLSKTVGARAGTTLSGLDSASRFYVLWRYTYGGAELDAGEAIIFANGTHVELDGHHSLTAGARPLLEKNKSKYRLLDFTERGDDSHLGLLAEDGTPASAVDALHRLLWLVEHKPPKIPDFLKEAKPNVEQLRLVAQALAGPALKGGELADVSPTAEQSALGKLLANWNTVMVGKEAVADRRTGQLRLETNEGKMI